MAEMTRKFEAVIRAGGVAEKVSSNFRLGDELNYQAAIALDRWCKSRGEKITRDVIDSLERGPLIQSGDYVQQVIWIP